MNKKMNLNETLYRIMKNSGMELKKNISVNELSGLIYKSKYFTLNEYEKNTLNEVIDFGTIYDEKNKNNKTATIIRKYGSRDNYIKHIQDVISRSNVLQKIFNDGDLDNKYAELFGVRIVIDNNLIKKRASELRISLTDKNFVKQYCTNQDKLDNSVIRFDKAEGNEKIDSHFLSLPAGVTCPTAGSCLSLYDPELDVLMIGQDNNGGICYAAAAEERFPEVRSKLYTNYYLISYHLKNGGYKGLAEFLTKSLDTADITTFRIHEDGDFHSKEYFKAWVLTAIMNPEIHFYFYTKNLSMLKQYFDKNNNLPMNMEATISDGYDKSQEKFIPFLRSKGVKMAKIFKDIDALNASGLELDKKDALAMDPEYNKDFGLVYHGKGLKGSEFQKNARKNAADPRKAITKDDLNYAKKVANRIMYNLYNKQNIGNSSNIDFTF